MNWLSQQEPSRTLHLNETEKHRKTMWRFKFFCGSSPQPARASWMRDQNKNKVETFQKPISPWDHGTGRNQENDVAFYFFLWVDLHNQNLPNTLHKRRARKACGVLILLVGWSSQPKPCRSVRLHDNKTMQPFICFSRWPSHPHPSKNLRLNEKPSTRKTI